MYKNNQPIEEKAYYFIMGIWYNINRFMTDENISPSMIVLKIHLLKEGAYYWRIKEKGSKNLVDDELTELNMEHNIFDIEKLKIGENRKRRLITYFIDWVKSVFTTTIYPEMGIKIKNDNYHRFLTENDFKDDKIINNLKDIMVNRFYDYDASFKITNTLSNKHVLNLKLSQNKVRDIVESNDNKNQFDFIKLNDALLDTMLNECTIVDAAQVTDLSKKGLFGRKGHNRVLLQLIEKSFEHFRDNVNDKYDIAKKANEISELTNVANETPFENNDLCLSLYLTLKNLYDKWICSGKRDAFKLSNENSDFKQFKYVDTFFHDIGQDILVNPTHVAEIVNRSIPTITAGVENDGAKYEGTSLFEYLSLICQKTKMVLMPLPAFFGMTNGRDIAEMFDAKAYMDVDMESNDTSTYICLYTYQPSAHLDLPTENGYMYENDGFDIADTWGNVTPLPISLADNYSSEYIIPSFGVTYAKQNQSYFKNISLNMSNHQVTDYSIAATFEIAASRGTESGRQTTLYGQDLYSIFSNYSYTCDVEALGNAQILPMMYFQLNNIPMWKGAYMIYKVEHSIKAGNMTTNFSGTRLNKNAIPFTDGQAIFLRDIYGDNLGNFDISADLFGIMNSLNSVDAETNTVMDNFDMGDLLFNVYYPKAKKYTDIAEENMTKQYDLCKKYGGLMYQILPRYGITEINQICMFIAQIGVESDKLTSTTEYGKDSYFAKYEGREDLHGKNMQMGDGLKFKGRGLIQLTGRINYTRFSDYMSKNFNYAKNYFVDNYEMVASPLNAILSACWYWVDRKINETNDIVRCSELVNGGHKGIDERKQYYYKAKEEIKKYVEFSGKV